MFPFFFLLAVLGSCLANETFIIGGNDVTEPGKYPWQGSQRTVTFHNCGISLIDKYWGVTAAHCVVHANRPDLRFMFGSNQRDSMDFVVGAEKIIWHEKYNLGPGIFANDIAVVKFDKEVVGENMAPVALAAAGSEHSGNDDCWITGFGYMANDENPVLLQEAKVNVYTHETCQGYWGAMVGAGHVCMGDEGKTSCSGDSGGPLVCSVDGRYELVGVTSWGPQDSNGCVSEPPSVYTRVEQYRDWIRSKTGV